MLPPRFVHLGYFTTLLSDLGSNVVSELLGLSEPGEVVSLRIDLGARRDHRVRLSPIKSS